MNVLFLVPYVPSLIRVRPYQLLRALAQRHDLTVLAAGSADELPAAAELRKICRRVDVIPLRAWRSLQTCAVGALRGEPLQAAYCRSPELRARLLELLEGDRFDLVHVEHLRAAHLLDELPSGLPTVYDAVDSISLLLERTLRGSHSTKQRLLALLELRRTRAYEARLLHRVDRLTATSPDDAAAFEVLAPGARVEVVPNGVDLDYFRPIEGRREPATLVISGKMAYHANVTAVLDFVRRVLPLIRQRHPAVRLRIVGSRPPRVIRALAREPAIEVTGHLSDVRAAIGRATLAVCPVTVKVGIQNKILEAMALGLPVVSTPAGVTGLCARPSDDLLVGQTPAHFAEQVCRLLSSPALRDRLGRAGRRYVETHHRWSDAAQAFEQLYEAAVVSRATVGSSSARS